MFPIIQWGYGVENYSNERWGYTQTIRHAKPIALIYYIPGYCLYPFSPLANFSCYGTTDACVKFYLIKNLMAVTEDCVEGIEV